eukprot:m.287543 g.287543  ORF g.287543 m.287543 type:complete len:391 (-) comp19949_c0_seq2:778-1950(-)
MTSRITLELLRKRAEHNECQISTLEEISLHQQDLCRIELLDTACRDLKILYLQNNVIPKIENVTKLRKLEYINLALNNVTKVEGLDGCESLQKVDLTVNFIADLTSVCSLSGLRDLRDLYLTGNPCADYEYYREYVVTILPQLAQLDGIAITRTERIVARQKWDEVRTSVEARSKKEVQREAARLRKKQAEQARDDAIDAKRKSGQAGFDGTWYCNTSGSPSAGRAHAGGDGAVLERGGGVHPRGARRSDGPRRQGTRTRRGKEKSQEEEKEKTEKFLPCKRTCAQYERVGIGLRTERANGQHGSTGPGAVRLQVSRHVADRPGRAAAVRPRDHQGQGVSTVSARGDQPGCIESRTQQNHGAFGCDHAQGQPGNCPHPRAAAEAMQWWRC